MANNGLKLPFSHLPGLDTEDNYRLRRNFEELSRLLVAGSSTIYDAIIDPALPASIGSSHLYKNLTDLLAGETLSATRTFTVGVIPRNSNTITESAAMNLSGPIAIQALGKAGSGVSAMFSAGALVKWDLNGNQLNSTFMVYCQGLDITNSGASLSQMINGATGIGMFFQCKFEGTNGTSTTKITAPTSAGAVYAWHTDFESCRFNGAVYAVDCSYAIWGNFGTYTINQNSGSVWWDGGQLINHAAAGVTINFAGATNATTVYVRWSSNMGTAMDGSTTGATQAIGLQSAGKMHFELWNYGNQVDISVSSGAGETSVIGDSFRDVTILTSGTKDNHNFTGSCTRALLFNGPGRLDASVNGSATTLTLGGKGVLARLQIRLNAAAPWLTMTGLIASRIEASFSEPGAAQQAYTIDATSSDVYCTFGGTNAANFSVASTNAGTRCRVSTETAGS